MSFNQIVYDIVKQIPYGRVTSYGHVALLAGKPRGAREVGWALAGLARLPAGRHGRDDLAQTDVPWWRVVNKQGYLSIRGHTIDIKDIQKQLLEKEGIIVSDEYEIDMEAYGW